MPGQPPLYLGMLVGRVVIRDEVNWLSFRRDLVDHAQELQPLLMAVPVVAHAATVPSSVFSAGNKVAVPLRL